MLQPCLAIIEQCVYFSLAEKILDLVSFILHLKKCVNLAKGSGPTILTQFLMFLTRCVLCEFSKFIQHNWGKASRRLRLDMALENSIDHSMDVFHKPKRLFLVFLRNLKSCEHAMITGT